MRRCGIEGRWVGVWSSEGVSWCFTSSVSVDKGRGGALPLSSGFALSPLLGEFEGCGWLC